MNMVRVILPQHLQVLANSPREVGVEVEGEVTTNKILTALEARYPVLRGAIREHGTLRRRPMVRFFVCEEDVSLDSPDAVLPGKIGSGEEPFIIIGAIAGG
jgi:sulfur-carrier protein